MGAWHQYFLRYPGGALNWTAKLGNHWSKVAILYSLHLLEVVEVVCKNLIEGVLKNNSASSILLLIPRKICFPSNILDHPTLSGFRDRRKEEKQRWKSRNMSLPYFTIEGISALQLHILLWDMVHTLVGYWFYVLLSLNIGHQIKVKMKDSRALTLSGDPDHGEEVIDSECN